MLEKFKKIIHHPPSMCGLILLVMVMIAVIYLAYSCDKQRIDKEEAQKEIKCTVEQEEEIKQFLVTCAKNQWTSTCRQNAGMIYGCVCWSDKFQLKCEKYYDL